MCIRDRLLTVIEGAHAGAKALYIDGRIRVAYGNVWADEIDDNDLSLIHIFFSSSAILFGILAGYVVAIIMTLTMSHTGVTADGVKYTYSWVVNFDVVKNAAWIEMCIRDRGYSVQMRAGLLPRH